ncbi:MAG: hypothetical protein R3Y68_05455 [Rikenellaceae bacterium]
MKRAFLRGFVLTLMVAVSAVCVAQPQQPRPQGAPKAAQQERPEREEVTPEAMAEKLTEMMKDKLELTASQEKKVYAANLDYSTKMLEARTLKEKHEVALVEILNADQTVKFFNLKRGGGQRGGKQQGGMKQGGMKQGRRPGQDQTMANAPQQPGKRRPPMPKRGEKVEECTECTDAPAETK